MGMLLLLRVDLIWLQIGSMALTKHRYLRHKLHAPPPLPTLDVVLTLLQGTIVNTPFEDLAVTLPGPGTSVTVRYILKETSEIF
jgi:hypothetical protein